MFFGCKIRIYCDIISTWYSNSSQRWVYQQLPTQYGWSSRDIWTPPCHRNHRRHRPAQHRQGLHLHQGLHSSSARRPAHTASRGATTLNIFNSATNIFHRYKIYKYFSNNHFRPKMHFHHHACSWHSIQKDCILPSLWNSIYNLNLDFVILTISTRVWQFSRQCQWCYNKFLAQGPTMRI